jgi:hypothetical protein
MHSRNKGSWQIAIFPFGLIRPSNLPSAFCSGPSPTPGPVCIQKFPNVFEPPWHSFPLYQNWHRIKIIFAAPIFDGSISYQKYFLDLIVLVSGVYDIFCIFASEKTSRL